MCVFGVHVAVFSVPLRLCVSHLRGVFRSLLVAPCVLAALICVLATTAAAQTLSLSAYPLNLNLSTVERLYKSAAYKVEVRRSGTADAFAEYFVFETRNDWIYYDFFGANPNVVLRTAAQVGYGKADMITASFAQFSFSNTAVDVRVTLLGSSAVANSVTIRPLRHAIPATISADKKVITSSMSAPLKLSVEINDRMNPLFLFTGPPDVPETAATATYYYGPGLHRIPGDGTLNLTSNQKVYIADGAIVVTEGIGDADCTFSASEESFAKIVEGEQNPTTAYMTGKLKIKGDMGAAMKLQKIF